MNAFLLVAALLLDSLLGEPNWLWSRITHPVVLMGKAIEWLDARLNRKKDRRAKGMVAIALLVVAAAVAGCLIAALPFGWVFELVLAAILIAHRSLIDHVAAVADALRLSVADGRIAVARIVGRDTAQMAAPDVSRAAIESAAENFSDGVVAPAFWFLLFGLPGLLVYKITNTADSMIGYRNARYEDFGWAAARLDDLLNWVPARLTALLFAVGFGLLDCWHEIVRDAKLHRSPNAGWPEAALSRAINVALAGPRMYDGKLKDYPFVNPTGATQIGPEEIVAAIRGLWTGWVLFLGIALLIGTASTAF